MQQARAVASRRWGAQKGGNTKVHLVVDAHGMLPRAIATTATGADRMQAGNLIEGMQAQHLIAEKGYDSDKIVAQAKNQGMQVQIPPRKNRRQQREYDKHLHRHLLENAFAQLKQ